MSLPKALIIPVVIVIIFVGILAIMRFKWPYWQKNTLPVLSEPGPDVVLELKPSYKPDESSDTAHVDVHLTSTRKVAAVDLAFEFDSDAVEIIDIDAGSFFDPPQIFSDKVNADSSSAFFAVGSLAPNSQTSGVVATLAVRFHSPRKPSAITLVEGTVVSLVDSNQPALVDLPVSVTLE